MFSEPQVRQVDLTRFPKCKPRNTRNTPNGLAASRPGPAPSPPRLLAAMEPRLSCGSCISWFLYFGAATDRMLTGPISPDGSRGEAEPNLRILVSVTRNSLRQA